jgi:Rrf2 family protein
MISRATEYGLIAVGYIALNQKEKQVITAQSISEKFNISLFFLLKILNCLVKAKILFGKRGPSGGFTLTRKPEKISLLEIIMAIEEIAYDLNFLEDKSNEIFLVRIKKVTKKAESELKKILSEATLADMIESKEK